MTERPVTHFLKAIIRQARRELGKNEFRELVDELLEPEEEGETGASSDPPAKSRLATGGTSR